MTLSLYITCFFVALVGMALQTALKMKSLQDKARAANIEFKIRQYFSNDWLSIVASLLTIVMFLLFLDNILKWKPAVIDYVKIGFAFVGYTGSDIASRLFGVVNKKINDVIDVKTNIADNVNEAPKTKL
jgi:uncharacterized membrane protein